jgi:hypothetical protein
MFTFYGNLIMLAGLGLLALSAIAYSAARELTESRVQGLRAAVVFFIPGLLVFALGAYLIQVTHR